MTRDDGTAQGDIEATAELHQALAAHFKGRPLPPDLVITTRTEIEQREFKAYGKGWRDRGEHDERRRAQTQPHPQPRPRPSDAKVLPFPPASGSPSGRPHPDDELS
ncbi:hypothetical protein ABZT04_14460 [Streptomyces sp. NPDC005492]|uniref:hypothetical protein n=1 Tax=Streptomyces sp. NPDC005492 TaxID=3156883 RepID=UPI0033AA51FB